MQLRLSLGSAFKTKKALSPTNYQLPMRGRLGRQWSVLAIDLPAMLQLHVDPPKGQQPPSFASLRGLTFCSHLKVRGAFTSDNAYTPETLPREMSFSTAAKTKWTDTCVAASPRAIVTGFSSRRPRGGLGRDGAMPSQWAMPCHATPCYAMPC